jgi:hypothetical protein
LYITRVRCAPLVDLEEKDDSLNELINESQGCL